MGRSNIQLIESMFESHLEHDYWGHLPMKHNQNHPPSIRDAVNLETMTVRELGEVAEQYGMTLLDVLTL